MVEWRMDCIFCKIIAGEIPADIVYEDDRILAFRDLSPQAPVHVLIVPKRHLASLDAVNGSSEDQALLGYLMCKVREIAEQLELSEGYRLVCNCGEYGLQTVQHLHFHLLGKRRLSWPPG